MKENNGQDGQLVAHAVGVINWPGQRLSMSGQLPKRMPDRFNSPAKNPAGTG